jgi:hypothetical protein
MPVPWLCNPEYSYISILQTVHIQPSAKQITLYTGSNPQWIVLMMFRNMNFQNIRSWIFIYTQVLLWVVSGESSATLATEMLHYKLQTRPLVREGAPRRRAKQLPGRRKGKKHLVMGPEAVPDTKTDHRWQHQLNSYITKLRGLGPQENYSDRPAKFADRGCHVVSTPDPHDGILGFLDRSHYYFFRIAQLCSRGWVDSVPDPLLLRKSDSAGKRTQDHEDIRGVMYRATYSWPWHQMDVSGQLHTPAASPPVPTGQEGWLCPRVGLDNMEKWKFFTFVGLEPWPDIIFSILSCVRAHTHSLCLWTSFHSSDAEWISCSSPSEISIAG